MDDVLEDIQKEPSEAIILKSNEGIQHLLLSSILYVEAMGRNTLYHTVGNRLISCPQSFSAACESLKKYPCFMKPHRSYLVNMNYIDTIESKKIKLHNLAWVPIAQGKIKTVKAEYLAFQMGVIL